MHNKLRTIIIWLICMGVMAFVYKVYISISPTPHAVARPASVHHDDDPNAAAMDSNIGKIAGVGVGTAKKAEFVTLKKDKTIDRRFGFERLLREEADAWDIDKPYMDIYRGDLKFAITADHGTVRVEEVAGRPSPKDASLAGNVVIRISRADSNAPGDIATLYLDDIIFVSDKSQFSTAGPVKLISPRAELFGRGLEFIYNDTENRLEYLRILTLDNLHIRLPEKAVKENNDVPPAQAVAHEESKPLAVESPHPDVNKPPKIINHYVCVFSKNVVIKSDQQLVAAGALCINDIIFKDNEKEKSSASQPAAFPAGPQGNASSAPSSSAQALTAPPTPQEKVTEYVITCDNGIVFAPREAKQIYTPFADVTPKAFWDSLKVAHDINDGNERAKLVASRVDCDPMARSVIATGPAQVEFPIKDVMSNASSASGTMPMTVLAQNKIEFIPALSRVVFEGSTESTSSRLVDGITEKYSLTSPILAVDLAKGKTHGSFEAGSRIRHITADGGVVQLAGSKKAGQQLLGFVKIRCLRFDYDPNSQLVTAKKGIFVADNSRIAPTTSDKNKSRFSLQKNCYVFLRDFAQLEYRLAGDRIIADAEPNKSLLIDYMPVGKNKDTTAAAGHAEATLLHTPDGRPDLASLTADKGITFEDHDHDIQFDGSSLVYDAVKGLMTVNGNGGWPCHLNGAEVNAINWDLKTGRINGKIPGPGILSGKR